MVVLVVGLATEQVSVRVVGLWEFGWFAPITEQNLWQFPLREFGVTEWIMCPETGLPGVVQAADVTDALDDRPAVFLDENGEFPLDEFDHPDDVTYVFGKSGRSVLSAMRPDDVSVRVSTPTGQGMMWAHQTLVVVLHDREAKR